MPNFLALAPGRRTFITPKRLATKKVAILLGIVLAGSGCITNTGGWYGLKHYGDVQPQKVESQGNTFGILDKPEEGRMVVTDTINRFKKLPLSQFELAAQAYFERSNRRCTIESAEYISTLSLEFFYSCAT